MYCITVQNQYSVVTNCIQCNTMKEVQDVLDELEPDMDSEYLISGEASLLTFGDYTYSFRKLETANQYIGDLV